MRPRDLIDASASSRSTCPSRAPWRPAGRRPRTLSIPPTAKRTTRRRSPTASIGWRSPAEFLEEAGVDRPTAFEHAGVWTITFDDGRFLDERRCPGQHVPVEGGRVRSLGPDGAGCGTAAGAVLFSAGWTLDGDQLRFIDVQSDTDQTC